MSAVIIPDLSHLPVPQSPSPQQKRAQVPSVPQWAPAMQKGPPMLAQVAQSGASLGMG